MSENKRLVNVKASVSRNYGGEVVMFEIAVQIEASGFIQVNLEYEKLLSMLHRQHEVYSSNWLPKVPQPLELPKVSAGVWITCEEMVAETKGGKTYFAIKGGMYSQHGVRIWNEVMREFELNFTPDVNGVMKMYNKEMLVTDTDGKKKVTSVRVKV